MKWKRKQGGGADTHAPENGDPLQVVQKAVAPHWGFAFHRRFLTRCLVMLVKALWHWAVPAGQWSAFEAAAPPA